MENNQKTLYDYMREFDDYEEDGYFPDGWEDDKTLSDKESYFDFYDDIKTTPKDDW